MTLFAEPWRHTKRTLDSSICRPSLSRPVLIDRRPMHAWQEGVHGVADRVESDRVRALLSRYRVALLQVGAVEHFDDSRIADRHVKTLLLSVKDDHVGHP